MSLYTSMTGLDAATTQLDVTSNNVANAQTTAFKGSVAQFGNVFASSSLQNSATTVGQGVTLQSVTQDFSQGNIVQSDNSLNMAISGSGFFPMESADGLQQVYTRDGQFQLNSQFQVVNSSGQKLLASAVDSAGNAIISNQSVLTIPQQTTGEAKATSDVNLGINFPASASVITSTFNPNDSSTYNYSNAMTVYDGSGNSYLATVYYVKTQDASQTTPHNTWQTYVEIGGTTVQPGLQQATNASGQTLYVNKYGQTASYSSVKNQLSNSTTQMYYLDQLTNTQTSTAASTTGSPASNFPTGDSPANFVSAVESQNGGSSTLFSVNIDGSASTQNVDVSGLPAWAAAQSPAVTTITPSVLAQYATDQLQQGYGGQAAFTFSGPTDSNANFDLTIGGATPVPINLALGTTGTSTLTISGAVAAINAQLVTAGVTGVTASYNTNTQQFQFSDSTGTPATDIEISAGTTTGSVNNLFGLNTTPISTSNYTTQVVPNGSAILSAADQRYGMSVSYDSATNEFTVTSGSTGDSSSVVISNASSFATSNLGISNADVPAQTITATRGLTSKPASVTGTAVTVDVSGEFQLDPTDNSFLVTVNGVKGTVTLPTTDASGSPINYTTATFAQALQNGINNMGDGAGGTVNGVTVSYNATSNEFTVTGGTTGANSFIEVSGSANWGFGQAPSANGTTSTWIKPTQVEDSVSGTAAPQYITSTGQQTASSAGYNSANPPEWSPIYLTPGQLTFNTSGALVSPTTAMPLSTVYLQNGTGSLSVSINYSGSTQNNSSFTVNTQSQNGQPEGSLSGVTIGSSGLVTAAYSNGTQKNIGIVSLATFSNPSGLEQLGNSEYITTAASGDPTLGTAGSAGYGTVQSGATESSNVNLTTELVNLITEQQDFQANSKAIQTESTMTSAIINMQA